jgi:hypothetical protein
LKTDVNVPAVRNKPKTQKLIFVGFLKATAKEQDPDSNPDPDP